MWSPLPLSVKLDLAHAVLQKNEHDTFLCRNDKSHICHKKDCKNKPKSLKGTCITNAHTGTNDKW